MKFLDWLLGREEPEPVPAPKGKIALLGQSNWIDAPFGLDLTGIPHTDEELDRASDLPGDFRRMHPDDQKAHLRKITVGEDTSTKVEFWRTTFYGKDLMILVKNGEPQFTYQDEDTQRKMMKKFRREYKK